MLQLVAGVWIINKIGDNIMRNQSKKEIEKAWELRKNGMLEVNKISGDVRLAKTKKIIPLYRYFSETDEIREYRALLDEDIDNYLSNVPEVGKKVEDQDIDDQIPQDCKWKALTGFAEDYSKRYEVSDKHGLVMDVKEAKLLEPYINNHGRAMYSLKGEDGSWKTQYVSRCVAMAWVENPDPKHKTQCHHINGKPEENDASNIMWVSPEEHRLIHERERRERMFQMRLDPEFEGRRIAALKYKWQNDPEYREKMSAAVKDRWNDTEYREKMSAAAKEAAEKPVNMLDLDTGNILKTFKSLTEAAEYLESIGKGKNLHSRVCSISHCLSGRQQKAFGFGWEYAQ